MAKISDIQISLSLIIKCISGYQNFYSSNICSEITFDNQKF